MTIWKMIPSAAIDALINFNQYICNLFVIDTKRQFLVAQLPLTVTSAAFSNNQTKGNKQKEKQKEWILHSAPTRMGTKK